MTERVARLRQQSLDARPSISAERAVLMTRFMQEAGLHSAPTRWARVSQGRWARSLSRESKPLSAVRVSPQSPSGDEKPRTGRPYVSPGWNRACPMKPWRPGSSIRGTGPTRQGG